MIRGVETVTDIGGRMKWMKLDLEGIKGEMDRRKGEDTINRKKDLRIITGGGIMRWIVMKNWLQN